MWLLNKNLKSLGKALAVNLEEKSLLEVKKWSDYRIPNRAVMGSDLPSGKITLAAGLRTHTKRTRAGARQEVPAAAQTGGEGTETTMVAVQV